MALRGSERLATREVDAGTALLNLGLAFDVKLRFARPLVHTQRRGLSLAVALSGRTAITAPKRQPSATPMKKPWDTVFRIPKGEVRKGRRKAANGRPGT